MIILPTALTRTGAVLIRGPTATSTASAHYTTQSQKNHDADDAA